MEEVVGKWTVGYIDEIPIGVIEGRRIIQMNIDKTASVCKQLDNLSKKDLNEICVSSVYNIIGFFMKCKGDESITKEQFENFIRFNMWSQDE